jgi:formate dehydrogenase accessory protein FdhD
MTRLESNITETGITETGITELNNAETAVTLSKNLVAATAGRSGVVERKVTVWSREAIDSQHDSIAEEIAVALVYNGISHAVMMVSPTELEEFARGFSLTEGIINCVEDILAIDIEAHKNGIEVALTISSRRFMQLKNRRRSLTGRTGCGICGAESLAQVRPALEAVNTQFSISHAAINRATVDLTAHQPLQVLTGAFHGAAWCDVEGNIINLCEDVGRHNALDKLIGLLWPMKNQQQKNQLPSVFQQPGFLLMSSRASYEIVQKAAKAGIAVVAAVSAPTSLAIDIAEETGITLIGFSRQHRHVAYTHSQRLTE